MNPKLSAWVYLFGQYDFNTTPIVSPGTKVVVHIKPKERASWAPNGEEAWSIDPSLNHYRCIKCYFPHTRSERDCDTVTFFPNVIHFPKVTTDDFLRQAATDIISILSSPPKVSIIPTLEAGDLTKNAILKLATLLNRADKIPPLLIKNSIPPTSKHNETPKKSNITAPESRVFPKN